MKQIKKSRDAWIGEGGNPRTNQRAQFVIYDEAAKTRHTIELHANEQLARDRVTFTPDGDADRLNPEQQLGRTIHVSDLVKRVQRMNPNLVFQATVRDSSKAGFYVRHKLPDGSMILKLVTGCENGWMPEFSVMVARMEDRPTANATMETAVSHAFEQTRGWRTVLVKLYVAGLVTEAQIEHEFHVSHGRSSALWQRQMQSRIALQERA